MDASSASVTAAENDTRRCETLAKTHSDRQPPVNNTTAVSAAAAAGSIAECCALSETDSTTTLVCDTTVGPCHADTTVTLCADDRTAEQLCALRRLSDWTVDLCDNSSSDSTVQLCSGPLLDTTVELCAEPPVADDAELLSSDKCVELCTERTVELSDSTVHQCARRLSTDRTVCLYDDRSSDLGTVELCGELSSDRTVQLCAVDAEEEPAVSALLTVSRLGADSDSRCSECVSHACCCSKCSVQPS